MSAAWLTLIRNWDSRHPRQSWFPKLSFSRVSCSPQVRNTLRSRVTHSSNAISKMYVHALHTVHAVPDSRIAGGRLRDGVSSDAPRIVPEIHSDDAMKFFGQMEQRARLN